MPLLGNTPKSLPDNRNLDRVLRGIENYKRPIGDIGRTSRVAYGYDGDKYWVEIGLWGELAFGRMEMTFEQAKAAYDAVLFSDVDVLHWDFDAARKALKAARKSKLTGDDLMFFFSEQFENFN